VEYVSVHEYNTYLKSASGSKRRFFSSREFLVGVQLGLSLALLIGMGLMIRSMMFRIDFPIGWSSQNIAVISAHQIAASVSGIKELPKSQEDMLAAARNTTVRNAMSFQDVIRELDAMPEVISAGYLSPIPFSANATRNSNTLMFMAESLPPQGQGAPFPPGTPTAIYAQSSSNGFDVIGVSFIAGRPFTEKDIANRIELTGVSGYGRNGGVAIINQAAAQRLWPGENAIGRILYQNTTRYFEVVGVVRNYHQTPGENDFTPTVYIPYMGGSSYDLLVKLRPGTSLQNFRLNVRQRLSGLTAVPTEFEVQPLSEHVKDALAGRRFTLQLLGCFAILGIVVSGLAVYATATLMAAARRREMGIRMAMGAQFWDILRLAFWRGTRAILVGLPLGLFPAWILSRALSSFLFQVKIDDPLAWVISCGVLLVITTIAALIPALRAARVNPLDVIRSE